MNPRVPDENARLSALLRLDILDTPAEPIYDDIAHLAAHVCQTPIALISFLDHDRQWFKAAHGVAIRQMPRNISFCTHAIAQHDPTTLLQIADARLDPRFATNPLVTQGPGIRFYAGIPLVTGEAAAVGTLCAVDYKPRRLNGTQTQALRVLGRSVVAHLELRCAKRTIGTKPANPAACPIDAESLLRRHQGKATTVEKLLTDFQEQILVQVESLRQDLSRRDAHSLARLAHSIEGSALQVSAEPLRASAADLAASVLANDFEAAAACLCHLEAEARDCIDYLPTAAAAVKRSTRPE